jgi:hypothetical protein
MDGREDEGLAYPPVFRIGTACCVIVSVARLLRPAENPAMLRRIAAVSLAVSFVAMATSGIMMFVIEKPSFTIQMHPVHKVFGMLMIVAAVTHVSLNIRGLLNHLKARSVTVYGSVLVAALVLLYGVALNNRVPAQLAEQMDAAAAKVEGED